MNNTSNSKREQILQATLNLVSERGFHGASVALIANEANVGMGTIYRHFGTKENLIIELYREIKSDLINAMVAGQKDATIRARFAHLWRNLATYYMAHPKALSFMEQYANSPYMMKITEEERRELEAEVYQFIQYAQAQGVLKEVPIPILKATVYGTIVSLVKRHISGEYHLDASAIELATNVSWDAVKR